MAPSPTIPTSFVPKQPVKSAARFSRSGGNTFLMLALFVLGVSIVGAIGVFAYSQYLNGVDRSKSAQLAAAESAINADTVEIFIRSRDRFDAARGILDQHVSMSNFFELLERITLVNVRFDDFTYTLLPDGSAEIGLAGSARSFNALAAQSTAFSSEPNIKRAIFSGIEVAENGTVSFSVEARLEPDLLQFSVSPEAVPVAPAVATTTVPAATSTSPATSTPRL